jgi:hypothetical protein
MIIGMHHFNLRASASEITELQDFYCSVLGLTEGSRPDFQIKRRLALCGWLSFVASDRDEYG